MIPDDLPRKHESTKSVRHSFSCFRDFVAVLGLALC